MLKVACSGPGVSRTRNLSVTSQILYHYTTAPNITTFKRFKQLQTVSNGDIVRDKLQPQEQFPTLSARAYQGKRIKIVMMTFLQHVFSN